MRSMPVVMLVLSITVLAWTSATRAAIVAPGGSFTTNGDAFVAPTGDVLANDARTVTVTLDTAPNEPSSSPSEPTYTFDLNFTSQVLRDPATQRLTFVYRFEQPTGDREIAREDGTFVVSGFAGFETDVAADSIWFGTRSADGATINADSIGQGQGDLPYFVIATDAMEFDSNGSLSGTAVDEFFVFDPVEQADIIAALQATFSLDGTFQPVIDDGGGNVIPLPAGVWLGLATLAGGGAIARARRRVFRLS